MKLLLNSSQSAIAILSLLGLISLTIALGSSIISENISEAHKLYCEDCYSSCNRGGGGEQADRRHYEIAKERHTVDSIDNNDEKLSIKLKCKCETIFDTNSKAFVCKNASSAKAKLDKEQVSSKAWANSNIFQTSR